MEGFGGIPFIHVVKVSAPRDGGLLLSIKGGAFQRTVPFSETGFILSLPAPGVYHVVVEGKETGSAIGELCVDGHDFVIEEKETVFPEAVLCAGIQTPEVTVSTSESLGAHELSTGLTVAVSAVIGGCIIALIFVCVCLMRRRKNDPNRILLETGSFPGSSSYYKH
jgi:hypothetical protein